MNATLTIAIALIIIFSSASGSQIVSNNRPASLKSVPMSMNVSCSSQTVQNVSPEVWSCFKSAVSLQMGYSFPATDTGRVSHNLATISYKYDPAKKTLFETVESKPFWKTCDEFNNRIREHVEDCRTEPTVSGPVKVDNADQWRIDKPDVRQPERPYPEIKLRPGDHIRVDADGCVQTGGTGQTWKLYVDPRGAKSTNLFHGTIRLPGMSRSQTIREFVSAGNNHQIGKDFKGDMKLYLGYQDERGQYANNGYWGHDDGDPVQCKGKDTVWVKITVYHQ